MDQVYSRALGNAEEHRYEQNCTFCPLCSLLQPSTHSFLCCEMPPPSVIFQTAFSSFWLLPFWRNYNFSEVQTILAALLYLHCQPGCVPSYQADCASTGGSVVSPQLGKDRNLCYNKVLLLCVGQLCRHSNLSDREETDICKARR